jgi:hypothetical protein
MAGQLAAGATARRYNGELREMGRDTGDAETGRGRQGQAMLLEAYQNPPRYVCQILSCSDSLLTAIQGNGVFGTGKVWAHDLTGAGKRRRGASRL